MTGRAGGRRTRRALGALVLVLMAAACGGDGDDGAAERRTDDPAEDVVWFGIDTVGPEEAVLPPELSREVAVLFMAAEGIPAAEATCVLEAGLPLVGGAEGFAELTVEEVAQFRLTIRRTTDDPGARGTVDACISPESTARKDAGELAPGIDLGRAREVVAAGTEQNAIAAGLTPEEARCYVDRAYRTLTDDQVRAGLDGTLADEEWDKGTAIVECLPAERIDELAVALEADILERQAESRREEQEFQDEVDRLLASTTTVPPGG